ncbi:hypothetical protein [Rhodanobacter umsongensis]
MPDPSAASFRAPGHPWPPLLFIGTVAVAWVVMTMRDNPRNAGAGLLIMGAGVPVHAVWRHLFRRAHP